jgi:hypothetical protein
VIEARVQDGGRAGEAQSSQGATEFNEIHRGSPPAIGQSAIRQSTINNQQSAINNQQFALFLFQ